MTMTTTAATTTSKIPSTTTSTTTTTTTATTTGTTTTTNLPVDGDADENVAGEKKSENSEEGKNAAEDVPGQPHHRRGPGYLQRHHHERHLQSRNKFRIRAKVWSSR